VSERTSIAWTDHTFNPWWGCERVSPACDHCYAEAFAKRTGHDVWGRDAPRRFFGPKYWAAPIGWDRKASERGVRERVFCASMADVFEDRRDLDEWRSELWGLIEVTPWLDWQLLTKRPENVTRLVDPDWMEPGYWPKNCWVGTTVENQRQADLRIPELLRIPTRIRFLSCEPLLGPLSISRWLGCADPHHRHSGPCSLYGADRRLQWVICGGESGPHHRPLNIDDARDLKRQCVAAMVPFFFKQDSGLRPGHLGPLDLHIKQFPVTQ